MKKFIAAAFFIIIVSGLSYSQSFTGNYYLGEMKVSIINDENYYYIVYEDGSKRILQYEENTPENDQIWLEWQKAKQTATLVFKSDYSSGVYTDYRTLKESLIKKRD